MPLYDKLESIKIDVSEKSVGQIVSEISRYSSLRYSPGGIPVFFRNSPEK